MKFFIASLFLILTGNAYSQVKYYGSMPKLQIKDIYEIGEARRGANLTAQLLYKIQEGDTVYVIYYNDGIYGDRPVPKTIIFPAAGNACSRLYHAINETLSAPKGTSTSVILGKTELTLKKKDKIGPPFVELSTKKGSFKLTQQEFTSLFGNKK